MGFIEPVDDPAQSNHVPLRWQTCRRSGSGTATTTLSDSRHGIDPADVPDNPLRATTTLSDVPAQVVAWVHRTRADDPAQAVA